METHTCGGARPPLHWIGDLERQLCPVTEEELEKATEEAFKKITSGVKRPRKKTTGRPHMIQTIGPPGAGKSIAAGIFVEKHGRYPRDSYAILDLDTMIEYHPKYKGMWSVPDFVTGKPTGVGFADFYMACTNHIIQIGIPIEVRLFQNGYNFILQSHDQNVLTTAKAFGYETTLLYVGVPLPVAQKRSRTRAIETGKFLGESMGVMDEIVASHFRRYIHDTPWYAMWADEFAVVDNGKPAKTPALHFEIENPHRGDRTWSEEMSHLYGMIKKVTKGADVSVPSGFSP